MIDLFSRSLVPSPEALESRVGDETVILHLGNDTYYGLDFLGTGIWELLKEGTPLPAICDRLVAEYCVDATRVQADVVSFVDDLLAHDLLVDA